MIVTFGTSGSSSNREVAAVAKSRGLGSEATPALSMVNTWYRYVTGNAFGGTLSVLLFTVVEPIGDHGPFFPVARSMRYDAAPATAPHERPTCSGFGDVVAVIEPGAGGRTEIVAEPDDEPLQPFASDTLCSEYVVDCVGVTLRYAGDCATPDIWSPSDQTILHGAVPLSTT